MSDNPFVPSFGVSPLYLAGRNGIINSVEQVSLSLSRSDYSRASLIIGQRGIGKTVLLNAVEDDAKSSNWLMVKSTATRGFLSRMVTEQLSPILKELQPTRRTKSSASIELDTLVVKGKVGIEELPQGVAAAGFRDHVFAICKAAPDRGLLFTIDEVNSRARDELEEFASVYQHAIREGLNVAVVMCGIPSSLGPLLSEDRAAMTFINRASRIEIGLLPFDVAREAFAETIRLRGTRQASNSVLDNMAALSKGYPFLIQEIGNKAWDVDPESSEITAGHLRVIVADVITAMNESVLRPIFLSLTDKLQEALLVIARNPGIRTTELGKQLNMPATAVSGLQQRLIEAGVILRDGRGTVRISIPYMDQYLASSDSPRTADQQTLAIIDGYPEPDL